MNKNNKMLFLQLHQIVEYQFVVKQTNVQKILDYSTTNKDTEIKIFIRPSTILAYKDSQVLLPTGWITVKETAEQICQQLKLKEM